jgi:hypothetical protein
MLSDAAHLVVRLFRAPVLAASGEEMSEEACAGMIEAASPRCHMKKFLVLYLAPASVHEDWSKSDPDSRRVADEKMRGDCNKWMRIMRK